MKRIRGESFIALVQVLAFGSWGVFMSHTVLGMGL
jgi:hypothetical protein